MSIHRRLLQMLSLIVILSMLFSGFALPSASAQGNIQPSKTSFLTSENKTPFPVSIKGGSATIQDPELTPVPTEAPPSTQTPDPEAMPIVEEIFTLDARASEAANLTGTTWYVSTMGNDSNACSNPAFPCATINGAIGKAINGDTIKVALGVYIGTGYQVVDISKSITLSGGWDTTFTAQQGYSTIDGQNLRQGVFISVTNVSLTRFVIQNCVGSGMYIAYWGGATISKSIIANNGGGSHGGGIFNEGLLTINNSSIHHNVTEYFGGGVYNLGSLTINNTTISHNSAYWAGGVHGGGTDVTLNNVTVSNNIAEFQAGGISSAAVSVTLKNTIVANNTAGIGHDCTNTITSHGYNIIGNTESCAITPATGDKLNVDPQLGELNSALGLQPLLSTSPAIDAGNPVAPGSHPDACLPVDQRETARPIDGPDSDLNARCDIGSYEYTVPGNVADLLYFNGSPQVAAPTTQLLHPMKVIALDNHGTPVPYVPVTFRAPEDGPTGIFATSNTHESMVVTDSNGIATAPTFTANNLIGTYHLVASTPDVVNTVTFVITNGYWLVATNGNDSNDCVGITSPCATIQGVFKKPYFSSGHTIRIGVGEFGTTDFVTISKSITISGGWNPTFTSQIGASTIEDAIGTAFDTQVTLENLTIRNNLVSAGITNGGVMTINRSSIIDNRQGIYNYGTLTIINSTISENGSINNPPSYGGGIENSNSQATARVTILNSTITNNIASHGGGIYNSSTAAGVVTLKNSIIADNTALWGGGSDCEGGYMNDSGDIISSGYNIVGTIGSYNGAMYFCTVDWQSTDIVGADDHPVNAKLDLLMSPGNGVWVHPIMPDSPAVDAIPSNNCPLIDQRGVARPQGASCDIGAYESIPLLTVTKTDDTNDGICNNDCSLREAINAASDGDTIYFDPALSGGTITLGSSLPVIDKLLIINGGGRSIAIDGSDRYRIFKVMSTGNLIINGLTLQNGSHNGSCTMDISDSCGGAIYNDGKLTVRNSTFSNNSAELGGAIFIENGVSDISHSTFFANSAIYGGGAILNWIGSIKVENSTFSGNSANQGGGIYNDISSLTLTSSTFSGNAADQGDDLFNAGNLDFINNILANSTSGANCYNEEGAGEISINANNLIEINAATPNNCGTPALTADPKLGSLASNGGPTQTLQLLSVSPAIDAGNDASCPATDQRGVTRPQGSHCDIGAYEVGGETTPPTVMSIIRTGADPTSAATIGFTVTFSEPVINVDTNDFTLQIAGSMTGASIGNVTGSGSTRTVTVNTGSGNGSLRLSVPVGASITDLASNPMANLPFTSGETYTILKAATFSDVEEQYWAWPFVERLYNAGITGGCVTNPLQYCPEGTVTRAQMAVFLLRGMHGSSYAPPAIGGNSGFSDVPPDHWAGAWIKQLAAEGITGGCGNGSYCPEAPVTRAQMAIFILRSKYGSSYNPPAVGGSTGFGDVRPTYWAAAWIKQLVAEGITAGCGNGNYCPEAPVTRAQMAVFLVRTFNLP